MKRPRFGDIAEIATPNGLAYAQYTHRYKGPPTWGDLIRVLPGLHGTRPVSFAELARQTERFTTFFPLNTYVKREVVFIVGHEDIPLRCRLFPTFRLFQPDLMTGRWAWVLWDGQREWMVDELTPEQEVFLRGPCVGNDLALIDDILNAEGCPSAERRELKRTKIETFCRFGDERLAAGDYVTALNFFKEAHATDKEDSTATARLAEAYNRRGLYYKDKRTLARAAADFKAALALAPRKREYRVNYASVASADR